MKLRRWNFLKELIPLLLLLLALDYSIFQGKLFNFQPSPLWLLILLIVPRNGSIAGIVCGLVAAALYLWQWHTHGLLWEDLLHRQPSILLSCGLFIFFGAFLGAISERQIGRMEFFREKANDLASKLDSDQIKQSELERKCVEMEKRIAGQGTTVMTIHDNFKRLGSAANEEELLDALDFILRDESKAENYGVWQIVEGDAQLLTGNFKDSIPPIALATCKNHKVISAADWSRKHKMLPGADLAALVWDNESRRLVAAVAGCPFTRLTRDFSLRIGLLAEQAGIVLGALRARAELRRQATLDVESGLVSETYLRRRVNEELSYASQYKTPLVIMACSIFSSSAKAQPQLETVLACSIRASIRLSDGVAWFPAAKAYVVVLPQRNRAAAANILRKIESNLKMLDLKDDKNEELYKLDWNIHVCGPDLQGDALFGMLFSGLHPEESP